MAREGIICHGRRKSVALRMRVSLRSICLVMENRKGRAVNLSADYAESVIDFMNAADLSRAVFIGHALGGAIALDPRH